jgi:hypothetical protein
MVNEELQVDVEFSRSIIERGGNRKIALNDQCDSTSTCGSPTPRRSVSRFVTKKCRTKAIVSGSLNVSGRLRIAQLDASAIVEGRPGDAAALSNGGDADLQEQRIHAWTQW